MYIYMYVYIYVCIYVYVCMYVCVYICIYIYILTHLFIAFCRKDFKRFYVNLFQPCSLLVAGYVFISLNEIHI